MLGQIRLYCLFSGHPASCLKVLPTCSPCLLAGLAGGGGQRLAGNRLVLAVIAFPAGEMRASQVGVSSRVHGALVTCRTWHGCLRHIQEGHVAALLSRSSLAARLAG